ncbi:MAG: dihydropteroate synthase [Thermoplasmata archaeon]|nr:dihydropteroate synthase [Thermoplasmata archaeon]
MPRSSPPSIAALIARYGVRVLDATTPSEIAREVERTNSDPEGVGIMTRKGRTLLVRLDGIPLKAAPLLKQEMLALGADSAHAKGVADLSVEQSAVVLLGTPGQYTHLLPKLRRQPFQLKAVADALQAVLENHARTTPRPLRGLHRSITLGDTTAVMGVLNVTPDSFSDGGRFERPDTAIARGLEIEGEGAQLLDLGAESSRPGAQPISADREIERLRAVLPTLHDRLKIPISVDTQKAEVARTALDLGADLVNDVSGLRDPEMRRVVARSGAPAVIVHMRGTPPTMQGNLEYAELRTEVYGALARAVATAIEDGVTPAQLLVDPGLGFGKSAEQNLELLHHLREFRSLGPPVVVGASRKSFLGPKWGDGAVASRLEASLAAAVIAALGGASVVRVHDVAPTVRALALADAVRLGRFRGGQTGGAEGASGSSSSITSGPT